MNYYQEVKELFKIPCNINGIIAFPSLCSDQQRRFLIISGIYFALWGAAWCVSESLSGRRVVDLINGSAGLRFCYLLVLGRRGLLLELIATLTLLLLSLETNFLSIWHLAQPDEPFYRWTVTPLTFSVVIFPLRKWMHDSWDFTNPVCSILFLVAALVASVLTTLASMCWVAYADPFISLTQQWPVKVFLSWLASDFAGILTIAPLLLVQVRPGLNQYLQQGCRPQRRQSIMLSDNCDRNIALLVILALLTAFGVAWSFHLRLYFPLMTVMLLLPLVWATLSCGLRGAVLSVAVLDCGLALLIEWFNPGGDALQNQWIMIVIALIGLLLGGTVEARDRLFVRYQDFAKVSNDLLWEIDADGCLREASGRLAEYVTLTLGQHWRSLLGGESQPHLTMLEHALAKRQPFHHLEIALQNAGGALRWFQLNGLPLFDESGGLAGYRGTAIDVTRQRQAETLLSSYNEDLLREVSDRTRVLHQINSELAIKERHLQVLLAAAPVGMLELDETHHCRYINANGCALTGCTPEQAQGRSILEFVHPDDRDYVQFIWQLSRQSDEMQWLEFRLNRTELWCAAHWIRLNNSDHALNGAIMVLTNATARRQQDERLWTLAHRDALTDLPNRSLFWDRLGQALRRAKRRESGAAVLWIDLDGFKAVNDRCGHAAGDALLQQVAQRLKNRMRDSDTVARMGGDEFAVILPDVNGGESESVMRVAAALIAGLAEPFDLPQGIAHISGSIGVALYPQHAETAETLTQYADMAMYAAKRAGKNQVHMWASGQQ